MRVRLLSIVFAAACVLNCDATLAQEKPAESGASCAHNLVDPNLSAMHPQRLNINLLNRFKITGDGWARLELTSAGQVLLAIVDPEQKVKVFDAVTSKRVEIAMPDPFPGTFTRGEWIKKDGRSMIHLGERAGLSHHFGVGTNTSYQSRYVGIDTSVIPLAGTTRGILIALPNEGRVRIMPIPVMDAGEPAIEINVPGFLRGAFETIDGRELLASISADGTLSVTDINVEPSGPFWTRQLKTNGVNATISWFKTELNEPALAVNDGVTTRVYLPLNPLIEAEPFTLAGAPKVKSRVRALSTGATSFIEAPGTEGLKIYRFEDYKQRLWFDLPPAIAEHQTAIFEAPNLYVYQVWVDHGAGPKPVLTISKIHKSEMLTNPEKRFFLEPNEVVLDLPPPLRISAQLQLMLVRTNLEALIFEITPQPAD